MNFPTSGSKAWLRRESEDDVLESGQGPQNTSFSVTPRTSLSMFDEVKHAFVR